MEKLLTFYVREILLGHELIQYRVITDYSVEITYRPRCDDNFESVIEITSIELIEVLAEKVWREPSP
jgi:hypothetical protein